MIVTQPLPVALQERAGSSGKITVDTESGVIRNVKFLGWDSKNPASALRLPRTEFGDALDRPYRYDMQEAPAALPHYNQVQVFEDHPTDDTERSVRTLVGETANPRIEQDGIYGDICYLRETEAGRRLAEVAQRMPHQLGCSHVATGFCELRENQVVITGYRPESVDVVTRPATTRGLHESVRTIMASKDKKRSLRDAILAAPPKTKYRAQLIEMMDDGQLDDALATEEPDGATPEDTIRQGLVAAIVQKLDEASDDQIQQVLVVLEIGVPLADASGDADEVEAEESLRRLEAKALLLESLRKATPERIEAVAAVASAKRKALVASWPQDLVGETRKRPAVVSTWESEHVPSDAYRQRVERLLSE
jgi:hypothetical protein